ncbi:MAG: insulinase family protein [Megasphaera sp.]|jgi:Zn-dependent M16 (insulinase) family peptidase|nr:insulinase family protein [Megasphaera sp.]
MELMIGKEVHGFHVDKSVFVKELNSQAYEMHHVRSGAKVLYIQNHDDNKVFSISFRTTPSDSTGVPHICEHSTLCGSRKFPLKEPFVELVKGSLNTFLNAMTFPDKTMYPVASRNAVDFKNLMDVYLDAVFFPKMLTDPEVLMQEGWHYELDSADDPLMYSGVVYNEMKGVYSSPDAYLERRTMDHLFPDTTYGVESGGYPDDIPQLTQKNFIAFHKKYYHPSNSYIFLYGDMDIDDTLQFINDEYLSKFTAEHIDSAIGRQRCPGSVVQTYPYGVASGDKTEHKTLHGLTYVIDDALDPTLALAIKVLTYVLLQSPAAPLKKALVDAGVGKDISGEFQDGILQPIWSITVNGSDEDKKDKILPIVRQVLTDMAEKGIDRTLLTGALNRTEFTLREADFFGRPKGLIYGIRCMDTWLYDKDPLLTLAYEQSLKTLRDGLKTTYYEDIIRKYILDNPYYALISLVPQPGMTEQHDQALADKLAAHKAALSDAEIQQIIAATKALKKRQATPDTPEALMTIPTLSRQDLEKQAENVPMEETDCSGVHVCCVPDFTNGITYVNAYFDLHGIAAEDVPYIYLLSDILGDIDTKDHTYGELAALIDLYSGGIDYAVSAYSDRTDNKKYTPVFKIKAKGLTKNLGQIMDLLRDISLGTVFTNTARLIELIEEIKAGMDMDAFRRGHTIVMHRVMSYVSPVEEFCDAGELSYYQFVSSIAAAIRTDAVGTAGRLADVMAQIFTKAALTVEITGDDDDRKKALSLLPQWTDALPVGTVSTVLCQLPMSKKNEGIMTSGTVQYVAKGGNFRMHGFDYTGALMVLDTILQYGYLWTKIRVQGGAYGAFTKFYDNGDMVFCSYRDPNLGHTVQAYDQLAAYLEQFDVSDREMTKYVIGTLSRIDIPLTPSLRGDKAMNRYFTGTTQAAAQHRRDQLLATTAADIRALAPLVGSVMKDNNLCVMGSEGKIREESKLFDQLITLPE